MGESLREIITSSQFRRDYKKAARSGWFTFSEFEKIINLLIDDQPLPSKYYDHTLKGNYKDHRECHIKPDCLLIYQKIENQLILRRLGSHSELF